MHTEVVLVGPDFDRLVALSLVLGAKHYNVTILHAPEPLKRALAHSQEFGLMLVVLTGAENVVELRALLSRRPEPRFLLLTPDWPPSAAVARLVRAYGSSILAADEPDVVTVATLVAMNAKSNMGVHGA